MAELAERYAERSSALFFGRLLRVPDDVFFAWALHTAGRGTCPRALADAFSVEQAPEALQTAAGFHKPWPYLPRADVTAFYRRALDDTAAPDPAVPGTCHSRNRDGCLRSPASRPPRRP
jgi:hypothetical protein